MKTIKKTLSVLFALGLMLTLLLPVAAVPASAEEVPDLSGKTAKESFEYMAAATNLEAQATTKPVIAVYAIFEGEEVATTYYCVAGDLNGTQYAFVDSAVYFGDEYRYAIVAGEEGKYMEWAGIVDEENSIGAFKTSLATGTSYLNSWAAAEKGQKLKFHYYDLGEDKKTLTEVVADATVNGGKQGKNSVILDVTIPDDAGGVYRTDSEGNQYYLPGALLDDAGKIYAIYAPSGEFVSFVTGSGGASGGSDEPAATEPPATEPPAGTEPPKGRSGDDATTEPATTPATDVTEPVDTTGAVDATGDTTAPAEDGKEEGGISWTVVAIVAAVAVVAVVAVVLLKNRKSKAPVAQPSYEPTTPAQPTIPTVPQAPEVPVAPVAPAPAPKAAALVVVGVGGTMDGRIYPITSAEITFGRGNTNTVGYPAETKGISRQHCKLFWHKGALMLTDLGSSYGTFLGGKGQLTANQPVPVKIGDIFYLGEKKNGFTIREG